MASVFSHAVVASSLGAAGSPSRQMPVRYWVTLAIIGALPDLDVALYPMGLNAPFILGHRGITHSLAFAAVFAALVVRLVFRDAEWRHAWGRLWLVFFVAMASHPILDAMTNGGQGIAFFAPFSSARWHFSWRPIEVSPIGWTAFFSLDGVRVLKNELVWLWLPSALVILVSRLARQDGGRMRRILMLLMAIIPVGCAPADPPAPKLSYPKAMAGPVVDDYGGTKVPDPYRWMEALDSKEVAEWVAAENAVTQPYLKALPLREHFGTRLTALWNYPRVGLPDVTDDGALFYSRNSGLQRQAPVYRRASLEASPTVALDPNAISEDGSVSVSQWVPSPDGALIAYGLSDGGSDWSTVKVRDVGSGHDLSDDVRWVHTSDLSWTKDAKGFFYSRYPEPPKGKALEARFSNHALYYHRVGTPQTQDVLVYQRRDLPEWLIIGDTSEDGRYLFVVMYQGAENKNRLYYADLGDSRKPTVTAPIRPLDESGEAEYFPFATDGSTLFVRTDKNAPNRAVVTTVLGAPGKVAWKTVVPERKEAIESVGFIGGRIVAQYLVDVQSRLSIFSPDGSHVSDVKLPGAGTVGGFSGRHDRPDLWYTFTSPLAPTTIHRLDQQIGADAPFEPAAPPVDVSAYETQALFATSKDGTKVPLFVTSKKGLARDGSHPTMVYGYGGFSVSILPSYRADVPAWLERGGIWVTVSMRGGAEYGEAWHHAGLLDKKQNVFDDFIAALEFLVREKFTSPAHLGIAGDSNGGLLVGAVMEQRPELMAVALPGVGVMDMLRFDQFTGGKYWTTEYGSASDPTQFPFLIKYSPLHNVKKGTCYPATLITTADHDDRVVPSHSFKFAATMQAAQGCGKPVLIRVEVQGSHGYRPTDKLIAESADKWAFAAQHMGMK